MQINYQKIIKLIIIILLIILLVQIFLSKGFSSCDKCRFNYEEKEIKTNKLLAIYEDKCFNLQSNFSNLLNQTGDMFP